MVWGLGSRVWGLGFRVRGLGDRLSSPGIHGAEKELCKFLSRTVRGSELRVGHRLAVAPQGRSWGLRVGVEDVGIQDFRVWVHALGLGSRVWVVVHWNNSCKLQDWFGSTLNLLGSGCIFSAGRLTQNCLCL